MVYLSISKLLFWSSGFLIFYSYVGYPVLLWFFSLFKSDRQKKPSQFEPKVSLLISAYNEEAVIEEKILNSLALDYPRTILEIIVISDGSNDMTTDIVERYAHDGVMLRHYEGRIGKTSCLNKAVPLASGDIIVFSDANSKYDKRAMRELVRPFADNKIGFVTGTTKYISKEGDQAVNAIGIYSRIEKITKTLESGIGSCVGADGAIFAIRKGLYQPLKASDINDLVIPLNIIKQGYKGKLENNAFCIESTAGGVKDEFSRQERITCRTLNAIFNNIDLLNPFKFGFFSFELLSHKICKLLVPLFMVCFLLSNVPLFNSSLIYVLFFMGQLSFYLSAWSKHRGYNVRKLSSLVSASYTFTSVNIAILFGWKKYLQGATYTTWLPTRRQISL